jgi:hypothetical protein
LNDTLGNLPRIKHTTKTPCDYRPLRSVHELLDRADAITANDKLVQKYHLLDARSGSVPNGSVFHNG